MLRVHSINNYIALVILSGVLYMPLTAQAGNIYYICKGQMSQKWSCVEESKKDEVFQETNLFTDCYVGSLDTYQACVEKLELEAIVGKAVGIELYRLCYKNTESSEAQCITKDSEWVDKDSNPIKGFKCTTGWILKDQCDQKLEAYFKNLKKLQVPVCCIPPTQKKSTVACMDITVNYDNDEEVNAKCAAALGGDENYKWKFKGACSTASDCKSQGAKKSSGGAGAGGGSAGVGVAPTNKAVGGGNFIIGNLFDPLGNFTVPGLIGTLIRGALSVIGAIALILFIYAGIMWMTASGNDERVKESTKIMLWAVIGLVVIFASYILLQFVFSAIQ